MAPHLLREADRKDLGDGALEGGEEGEDLGRDAEEAGLLGAGPATQEEDGRLAEELGHVLVGGGDGAEPEVAAVGDAPGGSEEGREVGKAVALDGNAAVAPQGEDDRHHFADDGGPKETAEAP